MSTWLRWFPASAHPRGWRLIRFDAVDSAGAPVGKAIEHPARKRYPNEAAAQHDANACNAADGR